MSDHRRRIAAAIKAGRVAKGLRQTDLADLLECRQPAVAAWESGKAMPTVEMFFSIARVLKLDVDELINPSGSADPENGDGWSELPAAVGAEDLGPPGDRHTPREALSGGPLFGPETKSHA